MEKITTTHDLIAKAALVKLLAALSDLGMDLDELNDGNFWMVREQCRINNGTYTPIQIDGDDKMRFLHVSIDDPAKVSYTKNSDKGKQDIQTRTTLSAYCEKFGLDMPPVVPVDVGQTRTILGAPQVPIRAGEKLREKIRLVQNLIDEILADVS